jgi:hypothetical protein
MVVKFVSVLNEENPDSDMNHCLNCCGMVSVFTPLPNQLDDTGRCVDCYVPVYGYAMVFFLWQAFLIVTEIKFGRSHFFQTLGKTLPNPLRTFLVICLGLPVAHMFTEPYFRSYFFHHGQPGIPMLKALQ